MHHSQRTGASRLTRRPLILSLVLVLVASGAMAAVAGARNLKQDQGRIKVGLIT